MKSEFRELAMEWIGKAESDLDFANASFKEFNDYYSQICVLCHDAAEKYLKGYITANGMKPERIHDLVALLNMCIQLSADKKELKSLESHCRTLNNYYTPLKYPSHFPGSTREQAEKALGSAKQIGEVISGYCRI